MKNFDVHRHIDNCPFCGGTGYLEKDIWRGERHDTKYVDCICTYSIYIEKMLMEHKISEQLAAKKLAQKRNAIYRLFGYGFLCRNGWNKKID